MLLRLLGESDRDIARNRRFADPALETRYRDHRTERMTEPRLAARRLPRAIDMTDIDHRLAQLLGIDRLDQEIAHA